MISDERPRISKPMLETILSLDNHEFAAFDANALRNWILDLACEVQSLRRRDAAIEKHFRILRTALGAARIFVSRNQDKSDAAYVDGELDRGDAALSALAAGLEGENK